MNPQYIAPPFSLFAYGNNQTRRLVKGVERQAEFISFGARGNRMRRCSQAVSLLHFVERCLLRLVLVMGGQHLDRASGMFAWNISHEAGKEGA